MHFSRMASLFPYSVSSPTSVLLMFIGSVTCLRWKRLLRCQPRHSLWLGERELPAQFWVSCQLKELMTQSQAKHWTKARGKGGGNLSSDQGLRAKRHRWTFHLGEPKPITLEAVWSWAWSLLWKHLPVWTQRLSFLPSHRQILPELEIWGSLSFLQAKLLSEANTTLDHLSGPLTAEKSSPDAMTQLGFPLVPCFHSSRREVWGEDYGHFLGITLKPRRCVSKSSVVSVAYWRLL